MGLIIRSIVSRTGPGLALQEMMYGFIMALLFISASRFGIINFSSATDIIILMVGMDFTWGAIDCILFFVIDVLDQRRMLNYMRSDIPLEQKAEMMADDFDNSPLDLVDTEQKLEACRKIAELDIESEEEMNGEYQVRKMLSGRQQEMYEQLIELMAKTSDNADFFARLKGWLAVYEKDGYSLGR